MIMDSFHRASNYYNRGAMLPELSRYLENYLWPNYKENNTYSHMMSIVLIVNEKCIGRVPAWEVFKSKPEHFPRFFKQVLNSLLDENVPKMDRICLLVFLIHCFNNCEVEIIRENIKKLVSIGIWAHISPERREMKFEKSPVLFEYWNEIKEKDKDLTDEDLQIVNFERKFILNMINNFFSILDSIPTVESKPVLEKETMDDIHYCERFVELLIIIEGFIFTREFCNAVLDDCDVLVKCQSSNLRKRSEGRLFSQLSDILKFYSTLKVDESLLESI